MRNIKNDLLYITDVVKDIDKSNYDDIPDDVLENLGVKKNDAGSIQRVLNLIDRYEEVLKSVGTKKWFVEDSPFSIENCPKHKLFFEAGANYHERVFMASNRSGKSVSGAFETAVHLTGDYPSWWKGRRFDRPVNFWGCGSTARSTRDTVQKELIGPVGAWGTGMIPEDRLGDYWSLPGVPQGLDMIKVRHRSGGWSTIGFKNYEQDVKAYYGTAMDGIWLDEEVPSLIYNECLLRTMTTDGILYVTFTPLHGLTPFVVRFCRLATFLGGAKRILALEALTENKGEDDAEGDSRLAGKKTTKAVIQAGWDDIPWLTEDKKKQMLEDTEPHLRDARSKGIPAMGSGNVYPIPLEDIIIEPFEIPPHFRRLYALDVGWNKTAVLWGAEDPNTGTVYVYDEHYMGEQPPAVHAEAIKSRGSWMFGVIDPASRGRSQVDGHSLMQVYKGMGLKLFPANNEVEGGINNVWNLLTVGKLKIFKSLTNFQKEYMLYRRDERGKIIKQDDHLMDCFDAATEVLTADGWKSWPSVTSDDVFATVNLETDTLEYQRATELVAKPYSGDMVFLDNKAEQMVTPTHRMVVYERKSNYKVPTIKLAQDLTIWDKIKVGVSNWEGKEYVPPIDGCAPEDFAEMLGWWIAEGSLNHAYECNPYRFGVVISQIKEPHKAKLGELLDRMPQSWSYVGTGFQCTHKALYDYLVQFGKAEDKFVPAEIKEAKQSVIEAFLKGYFLGDGWLNRGGVQCSASVSKRLTDDIQELMFKIGRPGNVILRKPETWNIGGRTGTARPQWWFVESVVKTAMLRDSKNNSNVVARYYDGMVYCASVPNGTLVVRRNGKISVSGNCLRYLVNNLKRARAPTSLGNSGGMWNGTKRYRT